MLSFSYPTARERSSPSMITFVTGALIVRLL
jgi:hypothetical protein